MIDTPFKNILETIFSFQKYFVLQQFKDNSQHKLGQIDASLISRHALDMSGKKTLQTYYVKSTVSSTVRREKLDSFGEVKLNKDLYSHHINTSQLIWTTIKKVFFIWTVFAGFTQNFKLQNRSLRVMYFDRSL